MLSEAQPDKDFTSESDFQQIKDWNSHDEYLEALSENRLNPTSNKSRIETPEFAADLDVGF